MLKLFSGVAFALGAYVIAMLIVISRRAGETGLASTFGKPQRFTRVTDPMEYWTVISVLALGSLGCCYEAIRMLWEGWQELPH